MNIYNRASDKLNAILFLSEIWGQMRDATIIRYLDLANDAVNFDYYFGDTFSIGNVDLARIKCLKSAIPRNPSNNDEQNSRNKRRLLIDFSNTKLEVINISKSVSSKGSKSIPKKSSK